MQHATCVCVRFLIMQCNIVPSKFSLDTHIFPLLNTKASKAEFHPSPHTGNSLHRAGNILLFFLAQPSRHHRPNDPPVPAISTTSSKLISTRNIRPSAVPLPPPTGLISPQLTSFSHASRATSRPQTRPGVTAAPDTEADVLAVVSSRTYSAYAAGKESASGAAL